MTIKRSLDWLRYIEKALLDLDDIPLLGHVPPFEWEKLIMQLRELLQIPDLEIKAQQWAWHTPDNLTNNLGKEPACLNIAVLPIQGHVSLLMSNADINSFISWIVQHKSGSNALVSSLFSEGLLHFVAMEALHFIQPFSCFDGFILRILSEQTPPSSRSLVLDITLKAYKEEITCRLVMPEQFRRSWLQYFSKRPASIPKILSQAVEVVCSVEVAHLQMNYRMWSKIQPGDFIPLTQVAIDLKNNSGSVYLSVGQKPLFRVRIKNNGLKILEQPIYQEGFLPMDHDYDDLLSEISHLEHEKKRSLDPIPNEEGDFEESSYDENGEDEDSITATADDEDEAIAVKEEKTVLEKIGMVPLNVVVEMTRFKMTCEKLMQLKPGNLIELNVSLEKPVDLVVNGKKIATAELVRIGEMLGVQILDIG